MQNKAIMQNSKDIQTIFLYKSQYEEVDRQNRELK